MSGSQRLVLHQRRTTGSGWQLAGIEKSGWRSQARHLMFSIEFRSFHQLFAELARQINHLKGRQGIVNLILTNCRASSPTGIWSLAQAQCCGNLVHDSCKDLHKLLWLVSLVSIENEDVLVSRQASSPVTSMTER